MVQKQALSCLSDIGIISNDSINKILEVLLVEQPKTREEIITYCQKRVMLIKALGTLKEHPQGKKIDDTLISILKIQCEEKKFFKFFRRAADQEVCAYFSTILNTLILIGGYQTITGLKKLSPEETPYSELIDEAITKIQQRLSEASPKPEED
ncbi:MAG: hypothetical protein JRF02_02990 [Deltaproteobacteria bacterium]|nr:hypothetical protein [Deltaproteobacteria bacterium]